MVFHSMLFDFALEIRSLMNYFASRTLEWAGACWWVVLGGYSQ